MRELRSECASLMVARWCVYLTAGLVPLAASFYPGFSAEALPLTYDQYAIVKFALSVLLAGVGLAAWIVGIASRSARVRRVGGLDYVVLSLLGWFTLATLLSAHRPTSVFGTYGRFEGLIAFFTYVTIAFLALQVMDSSRHLRELALAFVVGGSLVSLYGLMQSFGLLSAPEGTLAFESERAFSTYGNPDMLGLFLLVPMCIALGLALYESDARLRVAYWAAFALNAGTLLLTFTRAAWLAAGLALALMCVAAWWLRVRLTRADAVSVGFVSLAILALGVRSVYAGAGVTNVVDRFLSLFEAGSGSIASRIDIWSGALSLVAARPIAGFGPDTVFLVWATHASRSASRVLAEGQVDSAHSLPLQLAAGLGLVGVTLYIVALGWAVVLGLRAVASRRESTAAILPMSFCVALLSLLAASLVSVTDAGLGVMIWLLAGAVAAPAAWSVPVSARVRPPLALALALLVVSVSAGFFGMTLGADHAMARARIQAGTEAGLEAAERAARLNPWVEEYRLELAFQHQDRFLGFSERGQAQLARGAFEDAETELLLLTKRSPLYLEGYVALAELYLWGAQLLDSGYAGSALSAAENAIELAPGSPGAIGVLAVALSAQGRTAEAQDVVRDGLEMMPGNAYLEDVLATVSGTSTE